MRPPSQFQFERTKPLRAAAYRLGELSRRRSILEIGAGEGPVAHEVALRTGRRVFALDIQLPQSACQSVDFIRGDAQHLPCASEAFDAVLAHFVLLWLKDPLAVLVEARRVLRPGGVLLLLAEPDLTRRQDDPDTGLGEAIRDAVRRSGGHPDAGARLGGWLSEAGLRHQTGLTAGEWVEITYPDETLHEVEALLYAGWISPAEARRIGVAERAATRRRVQLPLYWAVGWKE